LKFSDCFVLVLLLAVTRSASVFSKQSQINDPAKPKTIKDCKNKTLDKDFNLCCDLTVNDYLNLQKRICINLRQNNHLAPMNIINGYSAGQCKYNDYAKSDGIPKVYCKGSGNMDKYVMWRVDSSVRVLNPRNAERSLETCDINSNWSKCF